MKTAAIFFVAFVAVVAAQIQPNPPVTDTPPVVNPICDPHSITSWPDRFNCRRFHLCKTGTYHHMWCAPGRFFDAATTTCLVGGTCFPGAVPIELEDQEAVDIKLEDF